MKTFRLYLYFSQNVEILVIFSYLLHLQLNSTLCENAVENTFASTWHVIKQYYRCYRMDRIKATGMTHTRYSREIRAIRTRNTE